MPRQEKRFIGREIGQATGAFLVGFIIDVQHITLLEIAMDRDDVGALDDEVAGEHGINPFLLEHQAAGHLQAIGQPDRP